MRQTFIIIFLFYFFTLLQSSFLIHFVVRGILPNFVFILIILLNLLEKPQNSSGLLAAFFGGFFLDIFSTFPLGTQTLIFTGIAIFIKVILKKYIRPVFYGKTS